MLAGEFSQHLLLKNRHTDILNDPALVSGSAQTKSRRASPTPSSHLTTATFPVVMMATVRQ